MQVNGEGKGNLGIPYCIIDYGIILEYWASLYYQYSYYWYYMRRRLLSVAPDFASCLNGLPLHIP